MVPMRVLASLTSANRSRARARSVTSATVCASAISSPELLRSGRIVSDQTCSRSGSPRNRPRTSVWTSASPVSRTWRCRASRAAMSSRSGGATSDIVRPTNSSLANPAPRRRASFCAMKRSCVSKTSMRKGDSVNSPLIKASLSSCRRVASVSVAWISHCRSPAVDTMGRACSATSTPRPLRCRRTACPSSVRPTSSSDPRHPCTSRAV